MAKKPAKKKVRKIIARRTASMLKKRIIHKKARSNKKLLGDAPIFREEEKKMYSDVPFLKHEEPKKEQILETKTNTQEEIKSEEAPHKNSRVAFIRGIQDFMLGLAIGIVAVLMIMKFLGVI